MASGYKWGFLTRAYRIEDFAYMQQELYSMGQETDETLADVAESIICILHMNESTYISAKETPYEYKQIRKCKKWLQDFWE